MPLPTSDFHATVCLEMRMLKNKQRLEQQQLVDPVSAVVLSQLLPLASAEHVTEKVTPIPTSDTSTISNLETATPYQLTRVIRDTSHPPSLCNPSMTSSGLVNTNTNTTGCNYSSSMAINNTNQYQADLASIDSSDTYASCQTHPFFSQGDLTSDVMDSSYAVEFDSNNLYINPLGKGAIESYRGGINAAKVKKSASGDMTLRNLGTAKSFDNEFDDEFQTFAAFDTSNEPRGSSSTSLNETPVPKHRKTRFQSQPNKPSTRFEEIKRSQDSIDRNSNIQQKKSKRKLFEAKSISSATRLINQHLFGQSLQSKGKLLTFS